MKVACIDIGSNSVRLMIGEIENRQLRICVSRLATTRLGQGVNQRLIQVSAMKKTVEALRDYAIIVEQEAVDHMWVIATSAVRDAANRDTFIEMVKREVGLNVSVISGEQEALLGYLGVTVGLEHSEGTCIIDIGGGSTELIGQVRGAVKACSMQAGAVRMTEGGHSEAEIITLINDGISNMEIQPTHLVGVGGTITTLAAIALEMKEYNPSMVHGYVLEDTTIVRIEAFLASLSLEERKLVPGLQPQRADIILAGVKILRLVMQQLDIQRVMVSESDLLVGLPVYYAHVVDKVVF